MEINYKQPEKDEIEISCFGPGYGESIVLHLGNGDWGIIDSCINANATLPASIKYLKQINVDVEKQVKLIMATHWHDDHVNGLADTLSICKNAEFYCSDALCRKEFLELTFIYGDTPHLDKSGVSEFHKVINIVRERKKNKKIGWMSENKRFWHKKKNESGFMEKLELWALSPSDDAKLRAVRSITAMIPNENSKVQTKCRIPNPKQNNVSVAFWLAIGNLNFLFGGDVEKSGWKTILNNKMRPEGKAIFYKIAHHGSKTSHNDRIWMEMLEKSPYACLTPCQNGKTNLPTPEAVNKIISLTENAYSTATIGYKKIKRSKTVEKTMETSSIKILKSVNTKGGHFRLRMKPNDQKSAKVDCFGESIKLDELYKEN